MTLRPNIPVITELVNITNLSFLVSNPEEYKLMKKYNYTKTPVFA